MDLSQYTLWELIKLNAKIDWAILKHIWWIILVVIVIYYILGGVHNEI